MLCQICRFSRRNTLIDDVSSLRRRQPQFPKLISIVLVEERPIQGRVRRRRRTYAALNGPLFYRAHEKSAEVNALSREAVRIHSAFAKDIGRANNRVLRVWPSLSLKAQGIFEIERDHRRLGVLQHEIAQSPDGD